VNKINKKHVNKSTESLSDKIERMHIPTQEEFIKKSIVTIDVKEALPDWKSELSLKSWKELQYLGRQNIEVLIDYKKDDIKSLKENIKVLESYAAILKGKSREDIKRLAKRYDDPKIPRETLVVIRGSFSKGLEPTRVEDINRKDGSTTYNNCGWCKYHTGGSARYEYMISTNCDFLEKAGKKSEERGVASIGCLLTKITGEEISELVDAYQTKKTELQKQMDRTEIVVNKMMEIAQKAEDKPYLLDLRPYNHFNIGDRIIIFISKKQKYLKSGFIEGTVIGGYRHHDGGVSFIADEQFHNEDYMTGKGGSSGTASTNIMLKKEFDYLRADKQFAEVWFENTDKKLYSREFKKELLK